MTDAVICAYARSPFTPAHKGALAKTRPDDLLAQVIQGLLTKIPLRTADIEELLVGCAFPEGEQGLNIARMVVLLAQLPLSVGGVTINRFCGSSMEAIHIAAAKIACGAGEVFLCAGVESMSRVPMGGFSPSPNPALYGAMPGAYMAMGLTAEHINEKAAITRLQQEEFALASHRKAAGADFLEEIIPITTKAGTVTQDGSIRKDASLAAMGALPPAFHAHGTVTAATASPVSDGAAAVVVVSKAYAQAHGLPILANIKSFAVSGLEPENMGLGPIEASRKALSRAGLGMADIGIMELNEAFAVQSLAVIEQLGIDQNKINLHGGALALGHPLGASGARITGKAAQLLAQSGQRYALAAQCIGGGQGIATLLERDDA